MLRTMKARMESASLQWCTMLSLKCLREALFIVQGITAATLALGGPVAG